MRFALILALSTGAVFGQSVPGSSVSGPSLAGIVDTHVHCDPDSAPRSVDCLEAARLAHDAGMRALLFKNHFAPTVQMAYIIGHVVPGIQVFGGIVLNRAVGGINPEAVIQAATFKGNYCKVVWMPTFDAGKVVVSRDGKLVPEVIEVLQLIAKYKLALATGHVTAAEHVMLVHAARAAGIDRIVCTHPTGKMSIAQMKEAAADGAYIEFVYHSLLGKGPRSPKIGDYVREIRAVGAEHCILSSDLGQDDSPVHPAGWKLYLDLMRKAGITEAEIDLMARHNPAHFLGLE